MHEMAIMDNLLAVINDQIQEHHLTKVYKVHLIVGELTGVVPDVLRFCWQVSTEKTPCEGAELNIEQREAVALCSQCGTEYPLRQSVDYSCPHCKGAIKQMLAGKELYIDYLDGE